MKLKRIFLLLLSSFLLIGCKHNNAEQDKKDYTVSGDTVYVHDNALSAKIKTAKVEVDSVVKEIITAGTVQAIPTQFAYIAPPFSGRIVKSYAKLGEYVNVNTPLFEIISPDFTAAQKDYYNSLSQVELARKDLSRKKDLISNGVASQKELEEAQNGLNIAQKELENAVSALKVYQTNPKNMVLGQPLIIRAPISGNITETNIVTGQFIGGDSEPVATVADLSDVWVVAQVKEQNIRYIHQGDKMDIHIPAYGDMVIEGTVFHIDESIDEETRSIKVLSKCENKDSFLKIGMYATVHFLDKPTNSIVIPEKALLQDENSSFVFVKKGDNIYVKTYVESSSIKDGKSIVTQGLTEGDSIINQGGYYLK